MTDKRKAYEEKIEAQLKEWNEQISLLRTRADKARAEARAEYFRIIEALQRRQDEFKAKLPGLKAASDEAWEDLKTGTEKAWAEIRTALDSAISRFK